MANYITWLRERVGNDLVIVNFVTACITDDAGNILLQKRANNQELWGFPGGVTELTESAEEASIWEVKEETGFTIHIDSLIGIYPKYFMTFSGGDESQTMCHFFKGVIIGGERAIDHEETFDVQFFHPQHVPTLFCQIHQDMMHDYLQKRRGVYR